MSKILKPKEKNLLSHHNSIKGAKNDFVMGGVTFEGKREGGRGSSHRVCAMLCMLLDAWKSHSRRWEFLLRITQMLFCDGVLQKLILCLVVFKIYPFGFCDEMVLLLLG